MQAGRLIASLLRSCEPNACHQVLALIKATSSSTWSPAAVTTAAGRWGRFGQTHTLTTTSAAAEAAAATATQPPTSQPQQPAAAEGQQASSSKGAAKQQQQQPATKKRPNKIEFEKLQQQYQEQLSQHNVRDEANMVLLVSQAANAEQVTTALRLLRWDKMVRARQQRRYKHFTPHATRALLRAGRQAGMGTNFALEVVKEADELGLQVSLAACEDVIHYCIDKKDFFAAAEAWVYTRVYCADPSRSQLAATAEDAAWLAANPQQEQQPQEQPQQQRDGPLGWASTSLVRTYALGLAAWLQAGCVSHGHEQYARGQLQQLVAELEGRGAAVPSKLKQALEAPAASSVDAAPATADQPAAAAEAAAEAVEGAVESKTEPPSAA